MSTLAMFATAVAQSDWNDASNYDPTFLFDPSMLPATPQPSTSFATSPVSPSRHGSLSLSHRNSGWERNQAKEDQRQQQTKVEHARFISSYPLDDLHAVLEYRPGTASSVPRNRHCKAEQKRMQALCSEQAPVFGNARECKEYAHNFLMAQQGRAAVLG
uniref:Uncharacterized protein n=1 Tax=Florenciella parvula TaxID=236787 RepID=A0A7S2B3Q7_9STRA|mmetsp:Transcript_19795/g.51827  ORF Transcript_19795/g.51827 Transcript_19795/m.51827 type:complete len:159 (-) Transcript_19795:259-735(-)|eukprot:CAMPEP_0119474178 /NCGR_PEP_ID=MMETSP1344-20130328/5529_1 /TAXON_ID=236787 /ORGANISM="Florenciella parvula, Strain CCMP2471" /LENGTH=158 /DNA_ID=CAMNT_0007507415 /DNA_START=122 /DNA_END=598 /DNA_ORIENTATION=-